VLDGGETMSGSPGAASCEEESKIKMKKMKRKMKRSTMTITSRTWW
jgi:hypothetical protein